MLPRLLALCFSLVWHLSAVASPVAEPVDMLFRNWNSREGLPHDRVRAVLQTRDGFVWFATDVGVVRFDGAIFRPYGLGDGLKAPVATSLYETRDGALWIGTIGGGASVLRNGVIERTYLKADGLPSDWVNGFGLDPAGHLVASTLRGFAVFEDGRFAPPSKDDIEPHRLLPRGKDKDGNLWGIDWIMMKRWRDNRWQEEPDGPPSANAMCIDASGRPWAFGDNRLWVREATGWLAHDLPGEWRGYVNSISAAPDGTIWIAFFRKGLIGFRDGKFIVPRPTGSYSPDLVELVFTTPDGQQWITSSNGVYWMGPQPIRFGMVDDPAIRVSNDLGGLLEIEPGQFLLATQGNGFFLWRDGKSTRLNDNPDLAGGTVGNLAFRASNGSIWIANTKGLYEWKPNEDGRPLRRYNLLNTGEAPVWAMAETAGGLWAGTAYGHLLLLRGDTVETVNYGGENEPIKSIVEEADGTVWVGTRGNGLFRKQGTQWSRLGRESGLLSEVIRTLYLDPKGRLWVGTDGGGLAVRKGSRFVNVTSRQGLPSDSVSQIALDDGGRLWLGTHHGLAVVDQAEVETLAAGAITNLHPILINRTNGLISEECTIVPPVRARDGTWAFATLRGFFQLRPEDFQPDTSRPIVFLAAC